MRKHILVAILLLVATACLAADTVLVWPSDGAAKLKFTVGKLNQVKSYSGQTDYLADVTVVNVGEKPMPFASFYVYMLDKKGNRVGEGYMEVRNVAAGQQVKVPLTAHAIGSIASMQLQAQHVASDEPKKVATKITSVPAGANFKVDGEDVGITPMTVPMLPGKHTLEFRKEGYATASAPVEVTAGPMPNSISFELSALSQDTVVLRDGTTVLGDVTSVTPTALTMKASGKTRSFARNQLARVIFAERAPSRTAATAKKKSTKGR